MVAAAAAAAAPSDRLSNLSDDLLVRILSFAPAREAAITTVLSRRWRRPLFLRTATVNLDHRSYTTARGCISPLLHHCRALQDLGHALALHHHANGHFPRKVTVVTRDQSIDEDILLSACADGVVGVEELRLDCLTSCAYEDILISARAADVEVDEEVLPHLHCMDVPLPPPTSCDFYLNMWSLPLNLLPFAALRVLDLKGCLLEPSSSSSSSLAFPCLHALRLRLCAMNLGTLQDMVRAAPNLADLRLESLRFWDPSPTPAARWLRLYCPAATVVVVTNMATHVADACSLKLDAPRLRRFRYTQVVHFDAFVSFKSPAPSLERVHLEAHSAAAMRSIDRGGSLFHARSLKLTVYSIADIGVDHLPVFPNLEILEIEELCGGLCLDNHRAAAAVVVNLLRSCPAVRELRLKFCWRKYLVDQDQVYAMLDSTSCKSSMKSSDDDDGIGDCCDVLDVAGLFNCGCMLGCLRASLRKVVVQFDVDALSCFQVRLVKFLAENAMALEEVDIDGGDRYDSSCMDRKVARWRRVAGIRTSLVEEGRICCCCTPEGLSPSLPASRSRAPPPPPPLWDFPLHRPPPSRPARRSDLPVMVTPRPYRPAFPPPRPGSASVRRLAAFPNHPSKTRWRR